MTSDTFITRIAFAKYLYDVGTQQALMPDPLCSAALLSFHDCADLVFQAVYEHLEVKANKNRMYLIDYAEEIVNYLRNEKKVDISAIKRLNDLRNPIKHSTFFASPAQVNSIALGLSPVLDDVVSKVFKGHSFTSTSMVDLIIFEQPRQALRNAQDALRNADYVNAFVYIHRAFSLILKIHEEQIRTGILPEDLRNFRWRRYTVENDADIEFERLLQELRDTIDILKDTVKLSSIGIDMHELAKYRKIMPNIFLSDSGTVIQNVPKKPDYSREDFNYCLSFVIKYALRLQMKR